MHISITQYMHICFVYVQIIFASFLQVYLQTRDNLQPEERQTYTFQVISAAGGATISPQFSSSVITYAASDFPFGLFQFDSEAPVSITEVSIRPTHI